MSGLAVGVRTGLARQGGVGRVGVSQGKAVAVRSGLARFGAVGQGGARYGS